LFDHASFDNASVGILHNGFCWENLCLTSSKAQTGKPCSQLFIWE